METSKAEWRSTLRSQVAQLSQDDRRTRSSAACQLLTSTPEFAVARVVMIYLPMDDEVDTTPIALKAWQDDKIVLAPKIYWDQRRMIPTEINSLTTGFINGKYGVREPSVGKPMPIEMIDLVVAPGVGFSRRGHRLGRGAGFYDRFLSQPGFMGVSCGLGYDEQMVENLPVLDHDMPLSMLVTCREVLRFAAYCVLPT